MLKTINKHPLKIRDYATGNEFDHLIDHATFFALVRKDTLFADSEGRVHFHKDVEENKYRNRMIRLSRQLNKSSMRHKLLAWSRFFLDGRDKEIIFSTGNILLSLSPASPDEIEEINEFYYQRLLTHVFKMPGNILSGLDRDSRLIACNADIQELDLKGFKRYVYRAFKKILTEVRHSPFKKSAENLLHDLKRNPSYEKCSEIWSLSQTLLLVYAYELRCYCGVLSYRLEFSYAFRETFVIAE